MEKAFQFQQANQQRFIDELFDFLSIPSISVKEENKPDILKAAKFIQGKLLSAGADFTEIMSTGGHPVVYASKIIDVSLPTIMVYGHYDVQPVEPLHLWKSMPFKPEIRDGKIFARGADDDKGQLYMHVKAFECMVKTNSLPCNVKFMIEGEEEIGSTHLRAFCEKNTELLACDVILISDTTMIASDTPSLTVGLRGLCYLEVEVTGANRDLHSGLFGGAIANPINVLAQMIAKLKNEKNQITIPGFYDDVVQVSEFERADMAKAPFDKQTYMESLGVNNVFGEEGYSTIERTGIRPTLDVCGIWGGYTSEGAKTVLPSKAYAKISMRLVPNQKYKVIDKLFSDYFKLLAPEGVNVKVISMHGGEGYVSPIDTIEYIAAKEAIKTVFGKNPIPGPSGGSIPIVADFEEVLGVKSILMGFGLESDAIHSPNENFPIYNFFKGIETIPHFYKNYSKKLKNNRD